MALVCARCGTQNPDTNRFCQSCGTHVLWQRLLGALPLIAGGPLLKLSAGHRITQPRRPAARLSRLRPLGEHGGLREVENELG